MVLTNLETCTCPVILTSKTHNSNNCMSHQTWWQLSKHNNGLKWSRVTENQVWNSCIASAFLWTFHGKSTEEKNRCFFHAFLELQRPLTHFMAKGHVSVFNQYIVVQAQRTGGQDIGEEKMMNESSRKVWHIWLQNRQFIHEAAYCLWKDVAALLCY